MKKKHLCLTDDFWNYCFTHAVIRALEGNEGRIIKLDKDIVDRPCRDCTLLEIRKEYIDDTSY